ncbi:MAG: NAD(P)-dependent alcohol dehydrogenase [Tropicimonas sp.]|uniref:NAD(P)-dependent alcohol dehydrogenase n=1 Tax=Tropicimonas sp. TaxID=2067044 RepID=UPI003A838488
MSNHAVYVTGHRAMAFGEAEMPEVGDTDLLIRMKYCGVCGSDVHFYQHGEPEFPDVYPFILGHEGAGEVIGVGAAVTSHKLGDRVCIEPGIPCRTCEWCASGRYNLCPDVVFPSAPRAHGILRDYVAHPAELCFKLPGSMSLEEGALIEPLAVAMQATREAGARVGQSAVILGSGCIGLVTLLALRALGLRRIALVDLHEIRLAKARELGAWETVNAAEVDPVAEVKRLFDGIGPDLVFETAGSTMTASQTIPMAKRGGTIMIVGNVVGQTPVDFQMATNKELTIRTSFRYRNIYPATIEAVATGLIDLKSIISRHYALRDAPQAFEDCIEQKATMVKAVIRFGGQDERS